MLLCLYKMYFVYHNLLRIRKLKNMNIKQYLILPIWKQLNKLEVKRRIPGSRSVYQRSNWGEFKLIMIRPNMVSLAKKDDRWGEFYGSCRTVIDFPEGTSSIDDNLVRRVKRSKKVLMIWFCMQLCSFKRGELWLKRKFWMYTVRFK
jgi:deoxyribose-phosphate aldolase